jgi:hypothetical protein
MKENKKLIGCFVLLSVVGYCMYKSHDWYWYWYALKDPLAVIHFEQEFKSYSNMELLNIMQERASQRTDAASRVMLERTNTDDIFDSLFAQKRYGYITTDRDKKVYNALYPEYFDESFTWQHAGSMQILAKLGYEEMIPEAGKFAMRGQYDEALEALKYLKSKADARELIEQIAAQNNDPFAADRAKKMLVN